MPMSLESLKGDEKYPLLLLYMEDEGKSKDFLREKKSFPGVSAVITRWPEAVSSRWTSLITLGFLFILLSLFLLLCPLYALNQPLYLPPANQTNLGKVSTIFLVHTSTNWTAKELRNLVSILDSYPTYNITIILLNNCENETQLKPFDIFPINSNYTILLSNEDVLQLNRRTKIIEEILRAYTNVKITRQKCASYFNTTRTKTWKSLSSEMRNFVVRTELLWNDGGITFDLDGDLIENITRKRRVVKKVLDQFIPDAIKTNFSHLQTLNLKTLDAFEIHVVAFKSPTVKFAQADDEVLTTLDGSIMMAQTPCHAFIDQILTNIGSRPNASLVLEKTISDFCDSKIENKFCDALTTKKI